jgi:hypothetical protein
LVTWRFCLGRWRIDSHPDCNSRYCTYPCYYQESVESFIHGPFLQAAVSTVAIFSLGYLILDRRSFPEY